MVGSGGVGKSALTLQFMYDEVRHASTRPASLPGLLLPHPSRSCSPKVPLESWGKLCYSGFEQLSSRF